MDDDFIAWVRGKAPHADSDWKEWLICNPEKKREVENAKQIVLSLSFNTREVKEVLIGEEWAKVKAIAIDEQIAHPSGTGMPVERPLFPLWAKLAAASVVLLLTAWWSKSYLESHGILAAKEMQALAPNGQQLSAKLADGTLVELNAGSSLTYPETFLNDRREVRLQGEAYFDVAANAEAPFIIYTEDVKVQVVGTKFAVKAYPESKDVKVAVVEGKVAVNPLQSNRTNEPDVLLTRDEMAVMEKNTRSLKVQAYDQNALLGWKNGILYFEKADFPQLINQLERWYGVRISVDEAVKIADDWRFSGKFSNKPIEYILDVCRYPDQFTYDLSDNKVFIKKQ